MVPEWLSSHYGKSSINVLGALNLHGKRLELDVYIDWLLGCSLDTLGFEPGIHYLVNFDGQNDFFQH